MQRLGFWLNSMAMWDAELSWSLVEPDKKAQAPTMSGTYIVEIGPNNKSYVLRFVSEAGERTCLTRFTAPNRVALEAEDHWRRLLAQQRQSTRLKPPAW
jgi:hypothetical protein